jgi:glycosyltransferase involved in cell wall biosynthesis
MQVSVITPTADRPRGIELCERYMARQTVQPDEWIVSDGGQVPAKLTMAQVHLRQPGPPGAANLACNVLRALKAVTGDVVIVVEDDDHYAPNHIEACIAGLKRNPAYGCSRLLYFNVAHRCWVQMANRGAALCQTAFRRELIPVMQSAAQDAMANNDFTIDGRFWAKRKHMATGAQTVIGIKGLAGTPGLGIGHRPKSKAGRRWKPDPELKVLRQMIGADAENYL